jgi:hypothetical protein
LRLLAKALDCRKLDLNATLRSLESFNLASSSLGVLGVMIIAAGTVKADENMSCIIGMESQQEMLHESAAAFAPPPNPSVLALRSMAT